MYSLDMIRKGLVASTLLIVTSINYTTDVYANAPVQKSAANGKLSAPSIFAQHESGDSVGNKRDSFFSITSLTQQSKLLTGTRGSLFLVSNDGRFSNINIGSKKNLYSALKLQNSTVLIGADRGRLYKTDVSLKTFKPIQLKQSEAVFDLLEANDNKVFAVGAYGLFMSATAPFETWYEEQLPWGVYLKRAWKELGESLPHLYSSCSSEAGESFVVGEYGLLLKYEGTKWVKLHGGSIEPALYGCVVSNEGQDIIAVGQKGLVIHSSDGGLNWESIKLKKEFDLYGIKQVNGVNILIANYRQLFISKSWKDWFCKRLKGDDPIGWYIDMLFTNNELVMVGNKGNVKSTPLNFIANVFHSNADVKGFKSCE
ncbi:photosystem II stability/assembly factor-like protein [Cycloclasticus sp. P1]|uniref:photosystem II stability/assembly factor-like protein n=1 Tax=Cycloclasticus sp. (strain P1) TaxID=385025 RepID=UPI000286ACB1|nr:photosystem II stability/assembly factor-like protein [Cycloclasticus sp. P1]AFT66918.1 Photosystem II stability/assembly factor-like protein [Cycloclasticus sp. P1]KXJ43088.1 MAG: hypothetical protein AXW16_05430 [Cycloclasticus sp. Phe_18]